ncbi:GNAT family N-acetyltransferase, partial [bacterium]|nr:GNAT family N-acetyltransferase [bacterium]
PLPGLPLYGEKLTIRTFRRSDEEARQQWPKHLDPYLARYNFSPCGEAENDIAYEKLKDRIRLAVDNLKGEMVGYVSFKPVPSDPLTAELGICFSASHVACGYGAEALELTLPWACVTLNLNRIVLEVDVVNTRAIHLYQQMGFTKTSEFWYIEQNEVLCEHFRRSDDSAGIKSHSDKIELLSWKMTWVNDSQGNLE